MGLIGVIIIMWLAHNAAPQNGTAHIMRISPTAHSTDSAKLPPAQSLLVQAQAILAQLSADEKLGQLIIPDSTAHSYTSDLSTMITRDHIGGYFINSGPLTAPQLRAFTAQLQGHARIPLILATDFEGGAWNPIKAAVGARPAPSAIAVTGDPQQAYQKGVVDAQLLTSVGLNVNFAPVVDVLTNPTNPILQQRTFGSTPEVVTTFATAYLDGLASGGVAGTIKHFPRLGAATVDPHKALPTVNRTLAQLEQTELVPYKALLASNHVPMIMTTHMLIPALDPTLPTSISPAVIDGLLRHQLGYDGVVISDALYMGGLAGTYDIPHAGLLAFEAGTDLLLGQENEQQVAATLQLLRGALQSGAITWARIDTSVLRILTFKLQWHIIGPQWQLVPTTTPPSAASAWLALAPLRRDDHQG